MEQPMPPITKIVFTIILLGVVSLLIRAFHALILKPQRLRSKLRKQGIGGPPPAFLVGNILQMSKARSQVPKQPQGEGGVVHNCCSFLFPDIEQWTKKYGPTFMFSLGNMQVLHMNGLDVVKEIGKCTSLEFGKLSYEHKLLGPLLGQGIVTSNGSHWAHQRKILAPMFTMESVKVCDLVMIRTYIPTKSNREIWRLEKKIRNLVLEVAYARKKATTQNEDILQKIVEGSEKTSALGLDSADRFIVDNFKNIYVAGYETVAVSSAWTLMLLATNPEWQDKARAEVLEVCGGQKPEPDMVRKMKTLTMIIYESLRFYPPVPQLAREAFQDLHFGDIEVPKGVCTWTTIVSLHQDPQIWGPDAHVFNPERFANGVSGACKQPNAYMPFGAGPRVCLGQNFAMVEPKILLAFILSNFAFSLSPKYRHSPVQKLVLMPKYGVHLLLRKL